MRKRILSVVMLSLLAVGAFAGMASAAYYKLGSLTASPSAVTATNFPYTINEITVSGAYEYNKSTAITGGNSEGVITWAISCNPTSMSDNLELSAETSSMGTKAGTATVKFSGSVKSAGTITVTGTHGDNTQTTTITVSALSAPTISNVTFGTATAGTDIGDDKVATLSGKPDNVTIKFGDQDAATFGEDDEDEVTYEGIKAEVTALDENNERTITFSGAPNFVNKSGLNIVVTAKNDAGSASKTYTLKVNGIKPKSFDVKPGKDLSAALDADKGVIARNQAIEDEDGVLTFSLTHATLPVTITAKNLPAGLTLKQTAGTDASGNTAGKGTATAVIEGTPTKAGKFTNISFTATNADGNYTESGYSMTVLDEPAFTTATLPDLTWGKAYSVTLKVTGGIDGYPVSFDIDEVPEGLSFDQEKGILKGTFKKADNAEGIAFGTNGETTKTLTITAKNALANTDKEYDLKIKAVKPTIVEQSTLQKKLDNMALSYDHEFTFILSADGPGTIKWDVPKLPAGVTSAPIAATEDAPTTVGLKLTGTPEITMKNETVKISPYNGAGSASFNLKFNVTYPSVDLTVPTIDSPKSVDKENTVSYEFTATPGPIVWKAKGLPSGLKLSIDKSVPYDTKAVVTGTLKAATKIDKNGQSLFYITAKNKVTGVETTESVDLKVYEVPKITTTSLPALTTGKAYKGKLKGTGSTVSTDMHWTLTVKVSGDEEYGTFPFTSDTGDDSETGHEGTAKLSVEYDKKTGDPTIVGSLDRIPTDGALLVHVELATDGGKAEKDLVIKVKGVAPKFTTTTLPTFKTDSSDVKVVATGTQPITMKAYIDANTAKKFFNGDGTASIDISETATGGFQFTDSDSANGEGSLAFTAGNYSFKGLPITFAATNAATAKPVVKVIKVNVTGKGVELMYGGKTASPDMTFFAPAGEAMTSQVFTLSGDYVPVELTTSLGDKDKNGITATIDNNAHTVTIGGTPTDEKETKTPITITAKNLSTNQKSTVKFTVVGMAKPVITTKPQTKEIQVGKSLNLKLQAKGSKRAVSKATKEAADPLLYATRDVQYNPISWEIASGKTLDDIVALGLSFDAATGTFKGTAMTTTSTDGAYTPYTFTVKAVNDAGDSAETIDITIGVKGRKIKFASKAIVINKGGNSFLDSPDQMLKTDIGSNDATAHVRFTWADSGYSTYGFEETITPAGGDDAQNYGQLSGTFTDIPATRGASVKVQAENMGTIIKGAVKVVINDAAPDINAADTKEMTADSSAVVTDTMDFKLSDPNSMLTGATKMKWTLSKKSTNAKLNVTLKADSDGSGATATLKVQKMTSKDEAVEAKFAVTVQNTITKASKTKEVTVTINPPSTSALPAQKDALPEDKKSDEVTEEVAETETETETEAEAEEEKAEGTVSYGEARTADWLTADERAAISEAGYVIAAVLPEITADAEGQYDLEAVTLSENAPEGESLVWFAFPRNAEKSDDDTIADFYDEAGAEITAVPESRNVIVSPWLREGVTYAPVIAVKAPVTSETKDSLDEAEEGDTVTLDALEEAAENASEDETPAE